MRRIWLFMRGWLVPALVVGLAAAATVPWSYWVIRSAYDREVNERASMLAQRVRLQMSALWYPPAPQALLTALRDDLLKDPSVQAVCMLDELRDASGFVRRSDTTPVPRSLAEAEEMVNVGPERFRRMVKWETRPGQSAAIYIELAVPVLANHPAAPGHSVGEVGNAVAGRIVNHILVKWRRSPQLVLNAVRNEIFTDSAVQVVCIIDELQGAVSYARRNESLPFPKTIQEADQLVNADPASHRKIVRWEPIPGYRSAIYIDLSRAELNQNFRTAYRPLLRNVIALTATGLILIGLAAVVAYRLWGRALRQRERARLEHQGLQAEHVLTAAVLAHEIRNPLAALRFQLASLRHHAAAPERVEAVSATIDNELQRIQQLLQDYLAHEKAQSMRVAPVDLSEAAGTLKTLMDELMRQTETRLIVQSPASRIVVACDPHALRQVLINLVLNAQQAMGRGGSITICIGQAESFGTISVADTGPGIPPEVQARLFKPFVTSKKGGSGIGLALVKRFVDNFGGSVSADSQPGQGTTFTLRLPLASNDMDKPAATPEPASLTGAR